MRPKIIFTNQKTLKPRKLLLVACDVSPGDIVTLTAAVRDLHRSHSGEFLTDVNTTAMPIWENNPYISKLSWHKEQDKIILDDPEIQIIECHYPLINECHLPYHFIHGYRKYLEQQLRITIPPTEFKGDIHLSQEEKSWISQAEELGIKNNFWIILAGGKNDFTAKWWNPTWYQNVVNYFKGMITFVQCGESSHWHPKLDNVIDLVGKTDARQFIRLVYHSSGIVCPVTFAMHLAAAVETKSRALRPCVVIAGGREPAHWEAYPGHRFLDTIGSLSCCAQRGCWRSRCQKIGDNDAKDKENLCEQPVQVSPTLRIPRCMHMLTPDKVISSIESYYQGGILKYNS